MATLQEWLVKNPQYVNSGLQAGVIDTRTPTKVATPTQPPPATANPSAPIAPSYTRDASGNIYNAQGVRQTLDTLPKGADGRPLMNLETLPIGSFNQAERVIEPTTVPSINPPTILKAPDINPNINSGTTNAAVNDAMKPYSDMIANANAYFAARDKQYQDLFAAKQPTEEQKATTQERINEEAKLKELQRVQQDAIQGVQERPLYGTALKSGIANEISNITQGNTRESLANLRLQGRQNDSIQTLMAKEKLLSGNQAQKVDAIKTLLDVNKGDVKEKIDLFKSLAPERIAINNQTGDVYFQNLDGTVSTTKIPGFTPDTSKNIPAIQEEYEYAKKQGYTGTLMQYQALKATQFGTEKPTTPTENKTIQEFGKSLAAWDMVGTREQFIRRLEVAYPDIDPSSIAEYVYYTYPDNYLKAK